MYQIYFNANIMPEQTENYVMKYAEKCWGAMRNTCYLDDYDARN